MNIISVSISADTTRCRIFIANTFANLIASHPTTHHTHEGSEHMPGNTLVPRIRLFLGIPHHANPHSTNHPPSIERVGVYISTKTFIRDSVKLRCVCALGWNGVGPEKSEKFNLRKMYNYGPFITQAVPHTNCIRGYC